MRQHKDTRYISRFYNRQRLPVCLKSCALFLSLFLFLAAHAQSSEPVFRKGRKGLFRSLTVKEGLPSNKVLDILQDRYGMMWFATAQGLAGYDGNHFFTYRHTDKDSLSLSDDKVTALAEDKEGNLWVGTSNGLNRYDRTRKNFIRYPHAPAYTGDGLKDPYVKALHADAEGNVWIETAGGYLSRLDRSHRQWKHYKHNTGVEEGEFPYWHIFEDSRNRLWLGGRTLQGEMFDPRTETFQHVPTWSEQGIALENSFYLESGDGTVFSSSTGSIQQYDETQKRFIPYCRIPMEAHCATRDANGCGWIGGNNGLLKWEGGTNSFTLFTCEADNDTSLPSNRIFCLYASQDGCVWIGTDNGIGIFSPRTEAFARHKGYHVTALMQDRDNYLWIGTPDKGAFRMDMDADTAGQMNYLLMTRDIGPATFQRERETIRQYIRHEAIYNHNRPLSERLADDYAAYRKADPQFMFPDENTVSSLYQDRKGTIYIGLWNHVGFNTYNPHTGQMKRHALWSKKPDYDYPRLWLGNPFGANWYNGFLEDSQGRFWCVTWECFGLNLFNRKKGRFESKHYFPNNVPCFPQGKIEKIVHDRTHRRLIMLGTNTYFGYYDLDKQRFYKYGEQFTEDYPNLDIVKGYYAYSKAELYNLPLRFGCTDILSDGHECLYMASERDIFCMSLKDNKVHPVYRSDRKGRFVWTLSTDRQTLLVHQGGRFFCIDRKSHRIEPCPHALQNQELEKEEIQTLHQAKDGSVWIGTGQALHILSPEGTWDKHSALTGIRLIEEMPDGDIHIASAQGLSIFRSRQSFHTLPFDKGSGSAEGIPASAIRDIYQSHTGEEWLATDNGLICLENNKIKKQYLHDSHRSGSLIDNNVLSVCEGSDRQLWIGTFQGICLYNPLKQTFKDMTLPGNDCLTSRLASCIMEDRKGRIWIGTTEKGVNVLTPADTIAHFWHRPWEENSLPDNYVECMLCTRDGRIWIGTHNGLAVYNETERNFTEAAGLAGYQIKSMLEDDRQQLWVSTQNGLFVTDRNGQVRRAFYQHHGLQGNSFSRAACKLKDGRLAFGGEYGFNLLNPQELTAPLAPGRIILSRFRVKDTPFPIDINQAREIHLDNSQNSFSIDFSAADYEAGPHLKYRYRLSPFDAEWTYVTPPFLTAKYARLPFGSYRLDIEAANAYGEWTDTPHRLSIHISAPWYLSWWFLIAALLSVIAAIAGLIRFRERRLRSRNEQLERLVSERTEKLRQMMESRNKFFNIISHDLKSPLSQLDLLSTTLSDGFDTMPEAEKAEKIQMIMQASQQGKALLDNLQIWALSQKEMIKPVFRPTNVKEETEAVVQLLSLNIQGKELRFVNRLDKDMTVLTDKNMLSAILRNLIGNAIKYSYRGGTIEIYATEKEEVWEVSIEDHGTGIPQERVGKLFQIGTKISSRGTEKETGTGLGLLIVNEFITRMDESIRVESIEESGTKFIFTLHKRQRK